jgi:hypothetical protein
MRLPGHRIESVFTHDLIGFKALKFRRVRARTLRELYQFICPLYIAVMVRRDICNKTQPLFRIDADFAKDELCHVSFPPYIPDFSAN